MTYQNYEAFWNLAKFINTEAIEHEGKEGLFIPFYENGLKMNEKGGVYATFFVSELKRKFRGNSHTLVLKCSEETLERMSKLGYDKQVLLGYMKPATFMTGPQKQYWNAK